MTSKSAVLAFVAIWLAARPGSAATVSTSMSVSVTVQAACIAAPSPIPIGSYISRQWTIAAAVSVTCTNPAAYTLGIAQSRPGDGIASIPAAMANRWAMQARAFGSNSRREANLDHVSVEGSPRHVPAERYLAVPASDSIMIVVTY